MRLIAIDPGFTTGYVDAEASSDGFALTEAGQFPWARRFIALQELLHSKPSPSLVIVESFRLYAHRASSQINNDFPSVRVIGAIEAYLDMITALERLVFQPASSISRVQVLPEHAFLLRSEHMKDAYKHLRYYWVSKVKGK